ncbi:MAG: orotidine 5'-phosphate decarboxylase / HUMPS family protein [Lapillicoccus sp.]
MNRPLVQVAIDVTHPDTARRLVDDALAAGADWLEIGKPFIEFNGIKGAASLIARHPDQYWLLDLMVIAGPRRYLQAAADIGARNVTITALAPWVTVVEAVELSHELGVDATIDLFNVGDVRATATAVAALDPAYLMVHFGVDQKRASPAGSPIADLASVVSSTTIPVSYATYDLTEARAAAAAGASVLVQGEPLLSADDPRQALTDYVAGLMPAATNEGARR